MSMFRDLDYWDFAAIEDVVTDDAYPEPADPTSHVGAALNYGLMRSLKGGQPWLLLESVGERDQLARRQRAQGAGQDPRREPAGGRPRVGRA